MKVALYARVSTIDKGQDVGLQLKDLKRYAEARGWVIYGEYIDACSGADEKRPELNRLLDDAKKRKIDGVLVWRLDRFGRSLKHLINTLDELRTLGITFVSFSENLDFSTSTGQLLFHLLGAFAEFERNLVSERVRAGIQNAKLKGKRIGRRPLIDSELSRTVSNMRGKGISLRQIAKASGVSKSLVHKLLKNSGHETVENKGSENEGITVP